MKIIAHCEEQKRNQTFSREFVRKAMIESWGWDQSKADSHLIMLEMGKSVTIESPNGVLVLEPA